LKPRKLPYRDQFTLASPPLRKGVEQIAEFRRWIGKLVEVAARVADEQKARSEEDDDDE